MLQFIKSYKIFLFLTLVWILLWLVPWGHIPSAQGNIFLVFLTDMFRLGIALLVFIFPGILLYILLTQNEETKADMRGILPIGFTFSVLIIAVIGLIGRVFGLSFTVVKLSFALIGLIELFLLAFFKPDFILNKKEFLRMFSSVIKNPPLVFALILVAIMMLNDSLFFIDDATYSAYLTSWQNATQLGFMKLIYDVNIIEHERFWLALYPMGQALLADLSGLPGLLLFGNYLELFLMPLALITSYWFARTLGLSRKAAGFSVLFQITLYAWMLGKHFPVGLWFYQSMAEDKVTAAFILAPVFFFFNLEALQNNGKRRWFLFFLTGIALTLTHPVVLFYSSFIVLCMSLFALITKKTKWCAFLKTIIIITCIMLPYLGIRVFASLPNSEVLYDAVSAKDAPDIETYAHIINDTFYGLNPDALKFADFEGVKDNALFQFFRLTPVLIVLLAGVIVLKGQKNEPLYWYIFSCILLVSLATLPYTGWILGYFVSARLLPRSSWFSPLGIGGMLVLKSAADLLKKYAPFSRILFSRVIKRYSSTALGLLASFVFISPMLLSQFVPRIPAYFETLDHNKQLVQVGSYIDENTTSPVIVIALNYMDLQLLPGISEHARLISFRDYKNQNISIGGQPDERKYASNAIRSLNQDIIDGDRCAAIERFGVSFVVAESDNAELFVNLVRDCKNEVRMVFETRDLILLEFVENKID